MTAAEHRAACEKKRGGMTATEAAIIHDLETLETDYHMLEAEMKTVQAILFAAQQALLTEGQARQAAEARAEKCRGMAVRHAGEGCEECRMLLEEVAHG